MASHYVAIAKASFAAGLLRPDPISVSRDEISLFHTLLDGVLLKCSPPNIQKCKAWLLKHVIPSSGRITALGKYFAALAASLGRHANNAASSDELRTVEKPSLQRKRLHILYLLSDLLHHTKYHSDTMASHAHLTSNLQPQLVSILTSAASIENMKGVKHHKNLTGLLDLWRENGYYSTDYINKLNEVVRNASTSADKLRDLPGGAAVQDTPKSLTRFMKETQFVMPAFHGDSSTPYYDLPAGNLMLHIVPNSSTPIDPKQVKPIQFETGPADEGLAKVVKDFLLDVKNIYGNDEAAIDDAGIVADIDEIGQPMIKHEVSGELVATEGYYGWSIGFCEKMKRRRRGELPEVHLGQRRGRSVSRSRSPSSTSRKRRRYSSSESSNRDRSKSRVRDDAHRPSRSTSQHASRRRRYPRSTSRRSHLYQKSSHSRSRSPIRSRSSDQTSLYQSGRSPARTNSTNQRPSEQAVSLPTSQLHHHRPTRIFSQTTKPPLITPIDQIDNPFSNIMPPRPPALTPIHYQHNFPTGPGGLPIPPPPPFHTGPWPPPMPNMPFDVGGTQSQYASKFPIPAHGFAPPPTLPNPPQLQRAWSGLGQSKGAPTPPPPPPLATGSWASHGHSPGGPSSRPPPPPPPHMQGIWQDQSYGQWQGGPPPPPPPPPSQATNIWQNQDRGQQQWSQSGANSSQAGSFYQGHDPRRR